MYSLACVTHRALKYIFDASRSSVPVLAQYKLIADEYKFCPVWISGCPMIADVFSRLCVIPAEKHLAMTNHEMVMVDYKTLRSRISKLVAERALTLRTFSLPTRRTMILWMIVISIPKVNKFTRTKSRCTANSLSTFPRFRLQIFVYFASVGTFVNFSRTVQLVMTETGHFAR